MTHEEMVARLQTGLGVLKLAVDDMAEVMTQFTSVKKPEPAIPGRGKIEAGAVVSYETDVVRYTEVCMALIGNRCVLKDDVFHKDQLTLVKSAELVPGCTVRLDDGREGFIKEYAEGWGVTTLDEGICDSGHAGYINPADLTILRQPEGK